MKQPLIILTGPTAVGKTDTSIALAKAVNGEIISADSMQVYRFMDIGSAKITPEEMQGVPHHLIDVLEPTEDFHVAGFKAMADAAISDIVSRGKIPILVGGTGFYIQAVLYDIDFSEGDEDNAFREEMSSFAEEKGAHALHEKLREVDPASAESIHENNVKRVIRALEFFHQTGKPISFHNETEKQKESPYRFAYFVLNDDRTNLYARIDKRVDMMFHAGLIDEVKKLVEMGVKKSATSMQGIGYKEVVQYLDGELTEEEAIYKIKRDTRHFAKRQITWFKRESDVIRVQKEEFGYDNERILEYMLSQLKMKEII